MLAYHWQNIKNKSIITDYIFSIKVGINIVVVVFKALFFFLKMLLFQLFLATTLLLSHIICKRFFPNTGPIVRNCGLAVCFCWILTVFFHFFINTGLFQVKIVFLLYLLLIPMAVHLEGGWEKCLKDFVKDWSWLKKIFRLSKKNIFWFFFYLFLIFIVLKGIRTLLIPPLGWDNLTYHGVKAGLWVKDGKSIEFLSPGGWMGYKFRLGGGEVFSAWFMLFTRNDFFCGFVEWLQWLGIALVLYSLGWEMKIKARYRFAAIFYVLFLPALCFSIGSGYVEPGLNLLLLLGLFFGIRFINKKQGASLFFSLSSFFLASGIKVTALPLASFATFYLILLAFIYKIENPKRWLTFSLISVALCFSPWLLKNIILTGYPLPELPLKLGPITLGKGTDAVHWYKKRPEIKPYSFKEEFMALRKIFLLPDTLWPQLSLFTFLPFYLFLLCLPRLLLERTAMGIFISTIFALVLLSFYHPGFSVVRLKWATTSGRFLLPLVCPVVLFSWLWFQYNRWPELYQVFLTMVTAGHLFFGALFGWAPFEKILLPFFLFLLLYLLLLGRRFFDFHNPTVRILSWIFLLDIFFFLPLFALQQNFRHEAAARSVVLHNYKTYWVSAAAKLDRLDKSFRIALTAGPWQNADNWMIYYFLGAALQNHIFYIPVRNDGRLQDYDPEYKLAQKADFAAWLERLQNQKIDFIFSFKPKGLELDWMEKEQNIFKRVEGDGKEWGLYRCQF
ncbi:hypothetical protein ACFL35_03365 [Candidatus Riflebacteria bacterium]